MKTHARDDCRGSFELQFDATGARFERCWFCGASDYPEKLKMRGLGHVWFAGVGLLAGDPNAVSVYGEERPRDRGKPPVVKSPVKLAFYPPWSLAKDDGSDHDGVSFRQLWTDPIARTLWLGFKPFMLTSQYFRRGCLDAADGLRRNPAHLLAGAVCFSLERGSMCPSPENFSVSAQLVPYLVTALDREGLWPYFKLPPRELEWATEAAR